MSSDQRHTTVTEDKYGVLPLPPPPNSRGEALLGEPEWAIQSEGFSFDATRYTLPTVRYTVRRAPWRLGTAAVTEKGIVIEGLAADPDGRFRRVSIWVGLVGFVPWLIAWGYEAGGGFRPGSLLDLILVLARMALVVLTGLISLMLSIMAEYRRVALREEITWDRILLIPFDRTEQVATVIYEAAPSPSGKKRRFALPLRLREKREAARLRASLERYVPERIPTRRR